MSDSSRLTTLLATIQPDEIYHLAAQSHVRVSFDEPEHTGDVTGLATTRLLEAIRLVSAHSRFYQASSSEMFGATPPPQHEETPFYPRSPYGAAKVYSYWMTRNYREAYGMFATNGILFNHESPRRGETFVTRKITRAAARIKLGLQDKLFLGNLDAVRDWGYAPEYVEAMWLMLQSDQPDDFVVATGQPYSIREFLSAAFGTLDLEWAKYVEIDPSYFRPTEVDSLIGSNKKVRANLNWQPSVDAEELAGIMTDFDLKTLEQNGPEFVPFSSWRY
jgi:GDPmannose 4,6-dehydratase